MKDRHPEEPVTQTNTQEVPKEADPTLASYEADPLMPTTENLILAAAGLCATGEDHSRPQVELTKPGGLTNTSLTEHSQTGTGPTATKVVEIAKTASTQIIEATNSATEATGAAAGKMIEATKDVSAVFKSSAEKAAKELEESNDDSLGPYGSLGTCTPNDMDPLAEAVHTGLLLEDRSQANKEAQPHDGRIEAKRTKDREQ
ncbi:uncharacterized protein K452DRAFT_2981 [Aplosporella prunicola CBS 121167]|uniref:Uncharacterized protein n=1 Tax=Aplosporella prunicola CBS 121167 TaxID=1176127 RepID=A0A6A6BV05_9PEZI|nr:uncharacterized protein K452DRAFT_2981 [Aplosporella prunicola CBS 121167]KAF2147183.1 hypothetical protein K452DRAFT_2981 [Aplosporella prunicola CBS 121167]